MNLIEMVNGCLCARNNHNYDDAIGCIGVGYNSKTDEFSSFSYVDVGHEIDSGRKLSSYMGAKLLIREVMFYVQEHLKNPSDKKEFSEEDFEEILDLIISKVSKK